MGRKANLFGDLLRLVLLNDGEILARLERHLIAGHDRVGDLLAELHTKVDGQVENFADRIENAVGIHGVARRGECCKLMENKINQSNPHRADTPTK